MQYRRWQGYQGNDAVIRDRRTDGQNLTLDMIQKTADEIYHNSANKTKKIQKSSSYVRSKGNSNGLAQEIGRNRKNSVNSHRARHQMDMSQDLSAPDRKRKRRHSKDDVLSYSQDEISFPKDSSKNQLILTSEQNPFNDKIENQQK